MAYQEKFSSLSALDSDTHNQRAAGWPWTALASCLAESSHVLSVCLDRGTGAGKRKQTGGSKRRREKGGQFLPVSERVLTGARTHPHLKSILCVLKGSVSKNSQEG